MSKILTAQQSIKYPEITNVKRIKIETYAHCNKPYSPVVHVAVGLW